jgi:hypothetical protein
MAAWNIYSRTISRAAELVGKAALASRLKVSVQTIDRWISGERVPATRYFLAAVDILDEFVPAVRCEGYDRPPRRRRGSREGSAGRSLNS